MWTAYFSSRENSVSVLDGFKYDAREYDPRDKCYLVKPLGLIILVEHNILLYKAGEIKFSYHIVNKWS